eukprot:7188984-Pyramimonas_sp.AAC.1
MALRKPDGVDLNPEGRLGRLEWPIPGREKRSRQGSSHHSSGEPRRSAREIGSDRAALRTVLTFVASLPAGRPAMTFGYVPTRKWALQMT